MVLEYLQSCHSLVVSNRHSLVLFTCLFVSPSTRPVNICFDLFDFDPRLPPTSIPA